MFQVAERVHNLLALLASSVGLLIKDTVLHGVDNQKSSLKIKQSLAQELTSLIGLDILRHRSVRGPKGFMNVNTTLCIIPSWSYLLETI